ncbi:hypothetical protein G6514_008691 [Epicoccum nigrum]|nr:hypothetical protein G6514_008691 [Epicoccum nigrum]
MKSGDVFDYSSFKAEAEPPRNDAAVWTTIEDSKLLKLVDAEMSWLDISYVMEKDEGECKDRFDKIKPKEWKFCSPKEKGLGGSGAAKKKGTMSSAEFVDDEVQNGWNTGINGKPISKPCDSYCGSEIKIPIDSDSVSGLEKTIATKDLPKVWKWVHDKGLGDKVGLQDAFDLARSIHKNDVDDGGFRTIGHRAEPRSSYRSSEMPMKQGFNPWAPW